MPHTCGDFWQMIWEQNTGLIVMLTKEEERGRTKCHPYVPSTNDGPVTYPNLGGLTVTLLEQDTMPNDDVLLRRVSLAKPSANGADETRSVWQLHYLAWPDHRASSPQSVLAVMDLARHLQGLAEKKDPACGPMLVHCSAGCGRTGTFCAIDSVLQLLERPRGPPTDVPLDPHGDADIVRLTVEAFREHRVSAVQTVEQYAFCYEAVLYRLLEWQHDVSGTRPDWVVLAPTSAGDTGVDVGVGSTGVKADSSSALVTDTSI
ncbi:hypothetical protein HKX48_007956 [Thoreauomyces humboldtii]|nr:hypothetical protein HKX48_007956 [Thoreauomyces humboldtii]